MWLILFREHTILTVARTEACWRQGFPYCSLSVVASFPRMLLQDIGWTNELELLQNVRDCAHLCLLTLNSTSREMWKHQLLVSEKVTHFLSLGEVRILSFAFSVWEFDHNLSFFLLGIQWELSIQILMDSLQGNLSCYFFDEVIG